jgi:hypothetical protein
VGGGELALENAQREHLQEARVIEHIYDAAPLTAAEQEHLAACIPCQRLLVQLLQLQAEFKITRLSSVTPEAEARYATLFAQSRAEVHNQNRSANKMLGNLSQWLTALPLWDSRSQALAAGVRGANNSSYRLLFGVDATEIELMVEAQNGLRRVMGEVILADEDELGGRCLIQLNAIQSSTLALETESDANGRFALEHVPPGVYSLNITPLHNSIVAIDTLELT